MSYLKEHGFNISDLLKFFPLMLIIVSAISYLSDKAEDEVEEKLPYTTWFEYDKIETQFNQYKSNVPFIWVYSYSQTKKDGLFIHWEDELMCVVDGHWKGLETQPWSKAKNKGDARVKPIGWKFTVQLPNLFTKCKIRSNVMITLPSGRTKSFWFDSNEFQVKPI